MQVFSNSWLSQHLDYNGFFGDGKNEWYYDHINQNIIDGNMMNMSLILMEGNYGDIDADVSSYHGYYIIKFYSSPYTLQSDLSIDNQVVLEKIQ